MLKVYYLAVASDRHYRPNGIEQPEVPDGGERRSSAFELFARIVREDCLRELLATCARVKIEI